MKKTAQTLLKEAFAYPRVKRSAEHKDGVLAAMEFRLREVERMRRCPHKAGSAQFDAWFAGTDEGHREGREYLGAMVRG